MSLHENAAPRDMCLPDRCLDTLTTRLNSFIRDKFLSMAAKISTAITTEKLRGANFGVNLHTGIKDGMQRAMANSLTEIYSPSNPNHAFSSDRAVKIARDGFNAKKKFFFLPWNAILDLAIAETEKDPSKTREKALVLASVIDELRRKFVVESILAQCANKPDVQQIIDEVIRKLEDENTLMSQKVIPVRETAEDKVDLDASADEFINRFQEGEAIIPFGEHWVAIAGEKVGEDKDTVYLHMTRNIDDLQKKDEVEYTPETGDGLETIKKRRGFEVSFGTMRFLELAEKAKKKGVCLKVVLDTFLAHGNNDETFSEEGEELVILLENAGFTKVDDEIGGSDDVSTLNDQKRFSVNFREFDEGERVALDESFFGNKKRLEETVGVVTYTVQI